jgi:hypothetical protein
MFVGQLTLGIYVLQGLIISHQNEFFMQKLMPPVSNNFCLGHKSTQVCRLHEKRPSAAQKKYYFRLQIE